MNKEQKYHKLYMTIAQSCAQMSYARRKKVGAVLVRDGRILSMGWNGMPAGFDNDCEEKIYPSELMGDFDQHPDEFANSFPYVDDSGKPYQLKTRPEVLHAELNCIAKLAKHGDSAKDSTMYVTLQPCVECSKLLIQSGVSEVFYLEPYRCSQGMQMLVRAGISVTKLEI